MKKLFGSAMILAFGTAVLYSISTAYYQGFLNTLGLNPDLLDRTLHQVLYRGMLTSMSSLLTLLVIALSLFLMSHAIIPAYVDFMRKKISRKRWLVKFKKYWFGKRKDTPLETHAKKWTRVVGYMTLFATIFLLYLAYSESKGIELAKEHLYALSNNKYDESNLINLKTNDKDIQLYLLACGSRNCAGVELPSKKIYYFEQKGFSFKTNKI